MRKFALGLSIFSFLVSAASLCYVIWTHEHIKKQQQRIQEMNEKTRKLNEDTDRRRQITIHHFGK